MVRTLRLAFGLFKLRIGIVIALTALAGMAIQPGASLAGVQIAVLAMAVLAASAAAGAFNQYHECQLDARMQRTSRRPFVTGALRRTPAWLALIAAMVAAAVVASWLAINPSAALYTFLGAFFYAIVYTVWLKRRTWLNIVIGGLAGSFAVLAGAAAVNPALSPEAMVLAVVLFLWTPPHFWSLAIAHRGDYAAAGVPMLPVVKGDAAAARAIFVYTILLVALSIVPVAWSAGWLYLVGALAGGSLFLRQSWRLMAHTDRAHALACFHASLAQLSILLVAAFADAALRS